ncbi:UNKNOWN [Stylonychia lemnae]|uniref:Uncharacterized protein n=1 Tax=Stylonychia lemnae TaxID=5949 RepID=A0A078B288_STYLE|nr:UNKNOWN [Stylonychia lemnae]|eukprot:CDW87568.1 UNKNOWN [Stylonychia lemnae]
MNLQSYTLSQTYKEVSETVIGQLRIVYDTYLLTNANSSMNNGLNVDNKFDKEIEFNQAHQFIDPHNLQNTMEISSVLSQSQQQNNIFQKESARETYNSQQQKSQSQPQQNNLNISYQTNQNQFNQQLTGNMNLFLQTQELQAENDYLKKQIQVLKSSIDDRIQEQKQMMEDTQTKDQELRELIDMVRNYEDQIRELQAKLEEQIYLHEQREEIKMIKQQSEIQAHQEIQQVKLLFQEFILVKDEIEKQMEDLVKRILDKDDTEARDQQLFKSQTAMNKFKEGFSNRKIQDIMRCEIAEVKEMLEVLRDLSSLIMQMISEKRQLKVQLQAELELRNQIEKALDNQELECLSPDLLIMKIKTLEHVLNGIQSIFNQSDNNNQSLNGASQGQNQNQSSQYLIYQQLRLFSTEQLDEKARLMDKIRLIEQLSTQQNEDIQGLITRVEECERENTELRIRGDQKIEDEKKKLLQEVEELKKNEQQLEEALSSRFEEEIIRIQIEQQRDLESQFVAKIVEILKISHQEQGNNISDYEEAVKYFELKVKTMIDKIEILTENKDLLMKERMIFEERMQEFSYESQVANKKIEQLNQQLLQVNNQYQSELQQMREEKEQVNQNANMLLAKFRQTASELHEVREEKEKLRKDVGKLQELIDQYDRRLSNHKNSSLQNSAISSINQPSISYQSRPPLSLGKQDYSGSPYNAEGTKSLPSSTQNRKPIQIYNSSLIGSLGQNGQNSHPSRERNESLSHQIGNALSNNVNVTNQQLRSSLDEKQLSNLIKDYKSENLKFSQKVQELQKKIQSTAQLSPFKQNQLNSASSAQTIRPNSSKPIQRNGNFNQNQNQNPKLNLNKQYFQTLQTDETYSAIKNQDNNQQNSGRPSSSNPNYRTLTCSVKKNQK